MVRRGKRDLLGTHQVEIGLEKKHFHARYGNAIAGYGLVLMIALQLIIMGCAPVGPNYEPPQPVSPRSCRSWHTGLEAGLSTSPPNPTLLAKWWTALGDPVLSSLEKRAVAGNLQLKEALARVREARALRGVKRSALFPALDATGGVTRQRTSGNTAVVRRTTLYTAGFDAGWELDIFGGARRSIEAAQAQLEAAQEGLTDVLVSLMAEVALNYANVRTYQARLDAVAANIKAQEDIYQLNVSRYKAGLIDELDVQQSLYMLENTRAQVPQLKRDLETAKNRLAVLLALPPGALEKELAPRSPIPVPPVQVAVGIPADTLRRRPDVRKAERELAAATAQIGVATAELYPKFRLSGSIGLESLSARDLLEWVSRTWKFGGVISWKIFDAGAIRQNIKVQTARQEQALARYEAAILGALEEVENALVSFAKEQRRLASLSSAAQAASRSLELARDRYKAGLVDFTTVLDAERAFQSLQDQVAASRGTVTSNFIRLYKALGGGWGLMDEVKEIYEKAEEK